MSDLARLTVFFDGSCPLCTAEIGLYRREDANQAVDFVDISASDARLDRPAAKARFHVMTASGDLLSGAAAFVEVWRSLPRWRWLARIGSLPLMLPVLELAYRLFLRARPWFVRMFVLVSRLGSPA